jgi:hypothetical protein
MRKLMMLLSVSLPVAIAPAEAQRADDSAILRAAVQYLKRDFPRRQLIIDTDFLHAAPADSAVRQLGAERGVIGNLLHCTGTRPQDQECTMSRDAVVLAVASPVVTGDTAIFVASWWFQESPGTVARHSRKLQLTRDAARNWSVTRVLGRGMS